MDIDWAAVKRRQAREFDTLGNVASGYGQHGAANACWAVAAWLRRDARREDARGLALVDLPDGRRSKKPWLPADDRDVTGRLVKLGGDGLPECQRGHGAMNRVDPVRRIYRCQEMYCGAGAELVDYPA